MRANGNAKKYEDKQYYKLKKTKEYMSIENMPVRPDAVRRFRHKPYSNDFRRDKDE